MLFKDISIVDENYDIKKSMNVLVEDGKVKYIGKDIPADYKGETYNGRNKVLAPGLFNIHTHIPMTLLRGYGDGLPLQRWLFEKIFPYESHLTGEDCYWTTAHGAIEMIRSGVVSFTDMYFFIEDIARAVEESGLKANLSHGISWDSNIPKLKGLQGYKDTEKLRKKYNDKDGKVKIDLGLHAEYTSEESLVREVADYAKSEDLIVHTHLSETRKEQEECKEKHGLTPAAYFKKCGIFDNPVVAAHCVWLDEEDFPILKEADVTVGHCISSNLKLGSGFAPIKRLLQEDIQVCFGTDGASSNNNLNILEEINLSVMANKGINHDPQFLTNKEVFKMATLNGAKSQRREESGSIKVGNKADLIVFDMDKAHMQPVHNELSNILFSAQSDDICLNMVDGKIIYKDGEVLTLDEEKIIYQVNKINKRILESI